VDLEHPVLTMGRSSQCDMLVDDTRASRLHAKIEYRQGALPAARCEHQRHLRAAGERGGEPQVRRDEMDLTSNGVIMLGRPVEPGSPVSLRFTLRQEVARL
jgi:adenylate cyclase